MSRTYPDPGFEPRVADWLEADPDLAPAAVLSTVLAAVPSIPQRRASRVSWRFPSMSTFAKVAVAATGLGAGAVPGSFAISARPARAPAATTSTTPASFVAPSDSTP